MRDPEQYEEHGRNDPLSPEQRQEHPYDFVSLPDEPARGQAVGHHRFFADRLTGRLILVYETLTPLHVGSGVFETAAECGLSGGSKPVRGIVRKLARPVLPGSGWKGVVRARFEAITRSRLGTETRLSKVESWKLPGVLRPEREGKVSLEITDQRVRVRLRSRSVARSWGESDQEVIARQLSNLSPAEALFGAMGYRGRIHPGDGVIEGPASREPLPVPPLEGPAAHRLAKPGEAHRADGGVTITKVEGRKFYYDGPLLTSRSTKGNENRGPTQELIDAVPAGCTITLDIHLESLTEGELGLLLVSAGWGENVGIVRFGGYKPAGLGKVRLKEVKGEVRRGWSTRRWHRPPPEAIGPARAVEAARKDGLIDDSALAELHEITTRLRP
ncbi:MAG TPA: RAMP superfamily CRISPR-associated protein [Thermoanaerobaculia bacterium]|jgi:CRISPR/Cas system CSM-associated protein Csm3 (group 7 of RAMP superfamily)|nr:RAMP superfamily CRISPR-associated protein [Thermoanaerobaculia bacterium]